MLLESPGSIVGIVYAVVVDYDRLWSSRDMRSVSNTDLPPAVGALGICGERP